MTFAPNLGYSPCMRCSGFPWGSKLLPIALTAVFMLSGIRKAGSQAMAHNMADMQPISPPDQLPAPIRMMGIGNSHIAIKATSGAQAWFDQGLSLLHDFWDYESAKAFEQAIRVDPSCAMCYWGLAQALDMRGEDEVKPYVRQAMAAAQRLKGHASASDKLYISAEQADLDAKEGDRSAAVAILRKLVKKNPHDLEARVFLAGAVGDGYDDKGEPKSGQKERISILESVLRDAPNDSAANHYWIHAIEPSNHPERALNSAALLASLAPTSGHMVHMPGHIYYRVGNYAEAERWFSASAIADQTYLRDEHVSVDDDWNYVHNMMYAIANLMEQGKLSDANALSDHLAAARGQLSATLFVWSARDQMARISRRLPVALRVGDWGGALELLHQANLGDGDKTTNLRFLADELGDFAAGMKAIDANDIAGAQAASDRMDAGLWRLQRDIDAKDAEKKEAEQAHKTAGTQQNSSGLNKSQMQVDTKPPVLAISPDAEAGPLMKPLGVASTELRAGILAGQGKLAEAKKLYGSAIEAEKKLGYHEPPLYIRPVGENEASAMLRAKDYAGAKAAYEQALQERPNSGFGLYGLAQVSELSGDQAGARAAYQTFLKAWSSADPSLPEIVHARKIVGDSVVAER